MKKLILLTIVVSALALIGADCDTSKSEIEKSPPKGTIELVAKEDGIANLYVYRFHDIERNEVRYIIYNYTKDTVGISP